MHHLYLTLSFAATNAFIFTNAVFFLLYSIPQTTSPAMSSLPSMFSDISQIQNQKEEPILSSLQPHRISTSNLSQEHFLSGNHCFWSTQAPQHQSYKASHYFSRCGGIFPYSHPKSMLWPRWKECRWILSLGPYISKERWGENSSLSSAVPFSCPVGFGKGKSKALLGSAQWYYERQWTQRPRSEELTKHLQKTTLLSNTENSCPNRLWNPDIQILQTEMVRP